MVTAEAAERELPANVELEQALLGAILANNDVLDQEILSEQLVPEHFADPLHAKIFDACKRLQLKGHSVSVLTLHPYFEGQEVEADYPMKRYLVELQGNYAPPSEAPDYAAQVIDMALRREAILRMEEALEQLWRPDPDEDLKITLDRLQGGLDSALSRQAGEGPVPLSKALERALDQAERVMKADGKLLGVTTGIRALDSATMGLHAGELVIIAARPSMGKSALAQTIALNASQSGHPALFFSLEMSDIDLGNRTLGRATDIDTNTVRGEVTPPMFDELFHVKRDLDQLPLAIDDSPGLTVAQMRSRARRQRRVTGLDLIVIDYLQLITASADRRRNDGRVQEVSEITRNLKALAKDLGVPVVALSQLNRDLERREDKRPQLADLRESGSIEQDADVVIFLYRDEYYLMRDEPKRRGNEGEEAFTERHGRHQQELTRSRGLAEAIIAKQRMGPAPRTVQMRFRPKVTLFEDLNEPAPALTQINTQEDLETRWSPLDRE